MKIIDLIVLDISETNTKCLLDGGLKLVDLGENDTVKTLLLCRSEQRSTNSGSLEQTHF